MINHRITEFTKSGKKLSAALFTVAIALTAMHCGPDAETKKLMKQAQNAFGQIPDQMPGSENDTEALVALGEKLYFEERLSANDNQSCATCHMLKKGDRGGDDGKRVSPGSHPDTEGVRNAPTTLNAGFHIAQFWDGRAKDLKEQAKGPILNPVEMGMKSDADVMKKVKSIEEYQKLFAKAYPEAEDPFTYDNLAGAIAAFERTLITDDRFDDFMAGKHNALSEQEKKGLKTFIESGCTQCHNGPLLGGNSYQKMGRNNPYENQKDLGRYKVTGKEADKMMFKVPSLRNIELTAPYFHDGTSETLEDAVKQMGHLQLSLDLSDEQVNDITAFLKTLTDKERR